MVLVTFFLTLLVLSRLWFHCQYVFHHQDPQPDNDVASLGDDCDHSVDCSDINVDKAMHIEPRKLVEEENRERRSRVLDVDGEAEEQGNLHHSPKKRKSSTRSESFEAYSGPAASHYEKNNLKGKR